MQRIKSPHIFTALFLFLFLAVYLHKNPFSVINQALFDRYSEGYVVCTIIRDSTDQKAGNSKLGLGVYPDKPACYSQFYDRSYGSFTAKDAYDYSDANWAAGISKTFSGFMVKRTIANIIKYTPGSKLVFPNGASQTIQEINVNPLYVNVRLDGPALTPNYFVDADLPPLARIDAPYQRYGSQIGVPGFIFSELYNITKVRDLNFYRAFNSTAMAAVLAFILCCIFIEFGATVTAITTLALMFSPWLLDIAGNLYWMGWTWYAPLALICLVMGRKDLSFAGRVDLKACVWYAVLIAVKASCGYEYMSTVMIASVVPIIYVGVRGRASILEVLIALAKIGFAGVAGFVLVLLAHAKMLGGTITNGMSGIREDMLRRTYNSGATVDPILGTNAPVLEVLKKYFGDLLQPIIIGMDVDFYVVLLVMLVVAVSLLFFKDFRVKALAVAFIFSILAPMSWFVLAKGHSFVHYFLNPVLWDLPTVPLGVVCIAVFFVNVFRLARKRFSA